MTARNLGRTRTPPSEALQPSGTHYLSPEGHQPYARAVQDGTFAKAERQRLIASLVSRKRIGTQLELIDALGGAHALRVVSRHGSSLVRGAAIPDDSIGAQLPVALTMARALITLPSLSFTPRSLRATAL